MKSSYKLLEKFLGEAPLLIDTANKQFNGLSGNQINWKPSEEKWSIGECIEHLAVTHKLYNSQIIELQLLFEDSDEGSFKFKHTFSGRMILKYVDPNSTTRIKTFKLFKPSMRQINANIIRHFCEEVETMISFAEKLHGADLTKLKISSPVTKLLRMNVGDALLINLYHDKRHLNQAEKIINESKFPK
ncbi:MAG: DinB family protein [Bacteroidetes bacterium]|nr:DinB family protein [Bacteroidota bacterium]